MAKAITPDELLAGLRRRGVKFKEYPGWRTRTRPGDTKQRRGGLVHHTGGGSASASYLEFLFETGRPAEGIPGPLCNVATAPDGTLHLGANGRANHAGMGSAATLAHVTAEDYAGYTSELSPGSDGEDGNDWLYGNEIIYSGKTPPTAAAYQTALLYAAVICEHHGWSALSWVAHREWTRRKDDPYGIRMNKFRTDLAALLKQGDGGSTPTTPSGELSMADAEAILAAIAKEATANANRYSDLVARLNLANGKLDVLQGWLPPFIDSEGDRYSDTRGALNELRTTLNEVHAAVIVPPTT